VIQTLQGVGRGKGGGEWVRRLVWGKYLDEAQGGHDLAGVFSGGKTIGVQPNAVNLTDKVFKFNWLSLFSIYRSLPVFGSHAFHFFTMPLFLLDKCQYFM
ncbi:MAG: hypothetical protein MUO29_05025, partial [Desulfobacterales bacterium]|nr:hypothetical protein [Desulfobacterales bacterium]